VKSRLQNASFLLKVTRCYTLVLLYDIILRSCCYPTTRRFFGDHSRLPPAPPNHTSHQYLDTEPSASIKMTATHGGLSVSLIAHITVGGIAGLLVLMVLIAWILDLPKRYRQRKSTTIMKEEKWYKSAGMN
jgi:hypothetical protein